MKAGDTVLVFMADSIEYIALWVALSKIGAIEVPINSNYRSDILQHVVDDSRARIMVAGSDLYDRVIAPTLKLDYLQSIVVHGGDAPAD